MRRKQALKLLRKITSHKAAIKSVSILWMGSMMGAFLAFVTQVLLARILGVNAFGEFSVALATVVLVTPLAGFGVSGFWLSIFGTEGWLGTRWLKVSIVFVAISSIATAMMVLLWAWFKVESVRSSWLLTVLITQIFSQAVLELVSAKLQLEEEYKKLSIWQISPHFLRFFLVFLIYISNTTTSVLSFALLYSFSSTLVLVMGIYQIISIFRKGINLKGHGDFSKKNILEISEKIHLREVISGSWPFGASGLFYLIYFQSSIILLSYFTDDFSAGLYNVAFIVMTAVYLFPNVIYQRFLLPKLHRLANQNIEELYKIYKTGNFFMLATGVLVMFIVWLGSPTFLPILFDYTYRDSIDILMVLAIAIPFRFVASSAGAILVTRQNMRIKVKLMGFCAIANVILNLILIPRYGYFGCALATVLTEFLNMAIYIIYVRKLRIFS